MFEAVNAVVSAYGVGKVANALCILLPLPFAPQNSNSLHRVYRWKRAPLCLDELLLVVDCRTSAVIASGAFVNLVNFGASAGAAVSSAQRVSRQDRSDAKNKYAHYQARGWDLSHPAIASINMRR